MCGRFASTQSDAELRDAFRVTEVVGDELGPSYNVAPTQAVRVVLERSPRGEPGAVPVRQLRTARWGLVPSWAKDVKIGARMINARSETIVSKPAFKAAASRRRCLAPSSGYFEWEKKGRSQGVALLARRWCAGHGRVVRIVAESSFG